MKTYGRRKDDIDPHELAERVKELEREVEMLKLRPAPLFVPSYVLPSPFWSAPYEITCGSSTSTVKEGDLMPFNCDVTYTLTDGDTLP